MNSEEEMVIKLPCKTVYYVVDNNTKYATIMSKSIKDLTIYEIEEIDNKRYFSTEDKAREIIRYDK